MLYAFEHQKNQDQYQPATQLARSEIFPGISLRDELKATIEILEIFIKSNHYSDSANLLSQHFQKTFQLCNHDFERACHDFIMGHLNHNDYLTLVQNFYKRFKALSKHPFSSSDVQPINKFRCQILLSQPLETIDPSNGQTPLHRAAHQSDPLLVQVLIHMGLSPLTADKAGCLPREYCSDVTCRNMLLYYENNITKHNINNLSSTHDPSAENAQQTSIGRRFRM